LLAVPALNRRSVMSCKTLPSRHGSRLDGLAAKIGGGGHLDKRAFKDCFARADRLRRPWSK
jgi:hypothetical protein